MTDTRPVLRLRFEYDSDTDNPLTDWDGMWTLHEGWDDTGQMFEERGKRYIPYSLDLFWKLRNGLAWCVGGYRSSQGCDYYATDYDPTDPPMNLLIWEHPASDMGAKTVEERKRDAQGTLDTYNLWVNGEVYGYVIEPIEYAKEREFGDSLWGLLGYDNPCEAVVWNASLPDACILVASGDLAEHFASSFEGWPAGMEVIDGKEWLEMQRERERDSRLQDAIEDGSEWSDAA